MDDQKQLLKKKLQQLKELAGIINLYGGRILSIEQRSEIENQKYKLEFQLQQLVEEVKIKEVDFKIVAMSKIIELLKTK